MAAVSTSSPLIPLEPPHALRSCRASFLCEQSSATGPSLPSIYVTFRVFQLVNTFRTRVKTRVDSRLAAKRASSTQLNDDFCQDFERQAYQQIDEYLGRKRPHPHTKRAKACSEGVHSYPTRASPATPVSAGARLDKAPVTRNHDWLLHELDRSGYRSLDILAKDHKLFLQRGIDLESRRLPLRELAHLLVLVKDWLDALRQESHGPGNGCLVHGDEISDPLGDDLYIANLEHLLLCLRDQLICQLVARFVDVVRQHLIDCQKDQTRQGREWFFCEFPDAKHPLSTTWPWSIRPSLAVLWSVCWMFYDRYTLDAHGNAVDMQGNVVVPRHAVQQFRASLTQRAPQSDLSGIFNADDFSTPEWQQAIRSALGARTSPAPIVGPRMPAPHNRTVASLPFSNNNSPSSVGRDSLGRAPPSLPGPRQSNRPAHSGDSGDRVAAARLSLAIPGTNTTFTSAAPPSYDASAGAAHQVGGWLPQEFSTSSASAASLGFVDSAYPADNGTWMPHHSVPDQQQQHSQQQPGFAGFDQPAQALPPQQRRGQPATTPTIRVTPDFPSNAQASDFSQPQAAPFSASSASPLPHTDFTSYSYPTVASGHLSPQGTYMPQDGDMQTPVSPVSAHYPSPHDTSMGDPQLTRKRSHSLMSQPDAAQQSAHHSRSGSMVSMNGISPHEEYSRGSHSFKRPDPPINAENKYICDFSDDCRDLTFDRKCEWSKHMDKHDRPYRCPHPSCQKLQGFTYSGGLLRHEREVHGKHGGPKAQLMCPHVDCKRHNGKGFTRKENLNEHLRRVHSMKDSQSQSQMSILRRDGTDVGPGADDAETPASRLSDTADLEDLRLASPGLGKRKRTLLDPSEAHVVEGLEEMRQEIKRLRAEADVKDQHIVRLQQDGIAQQEKVRHLEERLIQMQPQTQ